MCPGKSGSTIADLREQFDLLIRVRDRISETHAAVRTIHAIRDEVQAAIVVERNNVPLAGLANGILSDLGELEDALRQKRAKVWQDTANFEPLLDDQFAWLASYTLSADTRPTDSAYERYTDLENELAVQMARLDTLIERDVAQLREMLQED